MKKHRVLSFLVLVFLIVSFGIPVYADSLSVEEKADVLNHLSILSGNDNNDYNLDSLLRKNQAVVFIVRILGKAEYVEDNKEELSDTIFSDVKASSWYAPYVGYCYSEDYISGYANGTFGPEDAISEKQFLSMVLASLGYKSGEDFNSDSIYKLAYSIGLLKDADYLYKKDDNINYMRADAVELLYNMLTVEVKDTGVTIIEDLASEGIIDEDDPVYTDIMEETDDVVTAIASVTPVSQERAIVILNENVEDISAKDIRVYEAADTKKKLTVELESQSGTNIIIKTSAQSPDKEYTVEISEVTDLEGNTVKNIKYTFSGYKNTRLQTDFFRISKVDSASSNTINVFFTHPLNMNAEIPTFYEIYHDGSIFAEGNYQSMTVKRLSNNNEGISITLNNNAFEYGEMYELRVNGNFTSLYGTKINEGVEDSISFYASSKSSGTATNAEELGIESISALNNKTLEVIFNKEIDPFYAKQFLNYMVTGSGNVNIAVNKAVLIEEGDYNGRGVRLALNSPLSRSKEYELYINFITDISKTKQISGKKYIFYGDYPEISDLALVNADAFNKRTIAAIFDKPLDPSSAVNVANYTVIGLSQYGYNCNPIKASYEAAGDYYIVKLYLPEDKPMQADKSYKLRVSRSLQYNLGSTSSKDMEYTFAGSSEEYLKPSVVEALIVGKDTIKLTFDESIAEEVPNISPSNYILQYDIGGYQANMVPTSVIYIDSITLILKVDNLDYETRYRLKYSEIKDFAGINPKKSTDGQNVIDVTVGRR